MEGRLHNAEVMARKASKAGGKSAKRALAVERKRERARNKGLGF